MWKLNGLLLLCLLSLDYTRAEEWDYIVFTQSWPSTVCRTLVQLNSSNVCIFPQNHKAWNIHGIWPSKSGAMGPAFCNQSWLFDPEEVEAIERELKQSWTNILEGTPVYNLWAHEWNKHGTCAEIEPINTPMKYFSTGLEWLQKYTMTTILSEANIVPTYSKTYSQNDIHSAIKTKLGVDPEIYCKHDEGKQYLWELRICFSRSLELCDCKSKGYVHKLYNDDVNFITNCKSEGIFYES